MAAVRYAPAARLHRLNFRDRTTAFAHTPVADCSKLVYMGASSLPLERFGPDPDVKERLEITVQAPAHLVMEVATCSHGLIAVTITPSW
jgi:hypothetical protein